MLLPLRGTHPKNGTPDFGKKTYIFEVRVQASAASYLGAGALPREGCGSRELKGTAGLDILYPYYDNLVYVP